MGFSIADLTKGRRHGIVGCEEWSEDCPVSLDMLREVNFLHKDFSGLINTYGF